MKVLINKQDGTDFSGNPLGDNLITARPICIKVIDIPYGKDLQELSISGLIQFMELQNMFSLKNAERVSVAIEVKPDVFQPVYLAQNGLYAFYDLQEEQSEDHIEPSLNRSKRNRALA